jgi:FecR protein
MQKLLIYSLSIVLVMALSVTGMAANSGQFTELQGKATIRQANGQTKNASLGTVVKEGDVINTLSGAKVTLLFQDGSVLKLGPASSLKVKKLRYEEEKGIVDSAYDLAAGSLMSIVGSLFGNPGSDYQVETPTAVSGVRGTIYILKVYKDPETGKDVTIAVGVEGTTKFKDRNGNDIFLTEKQWAHVVAEGNLKNMGEMSKRDFDLLMGEILPSMSSLDERATGVRNRGGMDVPPDIKKTFDVGSSGGSGGKTGTGDNLDPDNLYVVTDNPGGLVFLEPPGGTDLILDINIPMP